MRMQELLLYKAMEHEEVLRDITFLAQHVGVSTDHREELCRLFYACLHRLIKQAEEYGFEGNLWHNYLTFLLVNSENAYSMGCEIHGPISGTINQFADHDLMIFKEYFDYDIMSLYQQFGRPDLPLITAYQGQKGRGKTFNQRIRNRICSLSVKLGQAVRPEEFKCALTDFYKEFGVGKLGLHKAFRIRHEEGLMQIVPIPQIAHVKLDDLIGYDIPKQKLIANTEAFVAGRKANNCLLFGDAGTGKSSCVKAILNQYYGQGLRMIELYKHQFRDLNAIIAQVKSRNYKFIIYMDDLSFEEFETDYKYLKAVIEGGLERKPDNVLIYATSNRRHLIREQFGDKEGRREDLHASDTVQEKLSLASRFGVSIFFNGPSPKEYQEIVLALAKRAGLELPPEELVSAANKWELAHNGRSGRTAQQFIDYLLGNDDQ